MTEIRVPDLQFSSSEVAAFLQSVMKMEVDDNTAAIIEDKCIDCGECITVCPHNAIVPLTDPFGELTKFRYTVALPSPGLHSQFGQEILPKKIISGLKNLGFDDAFDNFRVRFFDPVLDRATGLDRGFDWYDDRVRIVTYLFPTDPRWK